MNELGPTKAGPLECAARSVAGEGDELASVLRGDPASGVELRQALADLAAEGFVLVHRGDLAALRSAVSFDRLNGDTDLLAHVLVDALWDELRDPEQAAA